MASLVAEIARMRRRHRFLVVHGGGAEVTRVSELLGLTARFEDGVRMTSAPEMDVVDMVLAGKTNKAIVRRFEALGVPAVGLSGSDGGLFLGERLAADTRTARVSRVDAALLRLLMGRGYVPVVCSASMAEDGTGVNINADEAALALAAALRARTLLFLSDIPGILDRSGKVAPELDEREAEAAIGSGVISGGMIPKVRAAVGALKKGVSGIVIGQFLATGDLAGLLARSQGTRISRSGAGRRTKE